MVHARQKSSPLAPLALAATCAIAFGSTVLAPRVAQAEEVSPDGKGIAGGALLGAEIVTIPMALANVQSGVAYGVGAGLGAVAGGVGGYFVEQNVDDGRIPVYMLAGGLALVIPSIVLVLNATAYRPIEGAREDRAPSGPPADPGSVGGSVVIGAPPAGSAPATSPTTTPTTTPPATPPTTAPGTTPSPPPPGGGSGGTKPTSFIDWRGGALRMAMPVPEVRPVYSVAEQKRLGMLNGAGGTELRFPLVGGTF